MKLSAWITVSDLISIPQTPLEKIIEVFDKKAKFYHSLSHDFVFDSLKKAGVDGLELLVPSHTSDKNINEIQKILNKYNIPVLSIHQSLSNKKPFSLNEVEKLCKIASFFSASVIVLHSTTLGKSLMDKTFTSNLQMLQKNHKIKLGIENMSKGPIKSELFTYKNKNFSAAVNRAGLFMIFDTTHLAQTGGDIVNFFVSNKNKIVNIHLSDYKYHWINKHFIPQMHTHLPLKEGELPIKRFLLTLKKENYNGLITMEINSGLTKLCNSARIIKSIL